MNGQQRTHFAALAAFALAVVTLAAPLAVLAQSGHPSRPAKRTPAFPAGGAITESVCKGFGALS